jgi:CheY-like chemotaxis protein
MKILVTDDEREIRKILTLLLSSQGYEVVVAEDGEEAVEVLKADGSIDLCIMDIMMPTMSGI